MNNFNPILNVLPSPPDARDWNVQAHIAKSYTFPNELDYRPDMLPIRDQGRQGACAAMAGAAMKEWQEKIDSGISHYFSPQFLYNLRENPENAGMYMRDLLKILRKYGDCLESMHVYGDLSNPDDIAFRNAEHYKIKGYAKCNTPNDLRQALYEHGPVIMATPVFNYGYYMWLPQYAAQTPLGGHAMLLVGYNENGFHVRNSWGRDWGNLGYTWLPELHFHHVWEFWSTVDAESGEHKNKIPAWVWWLLA